MRNVMQLTKRLAKGPTRLTRLRKRYIIWGALLAALSSVILFATSTNLGAQAICFIPLNPISWTCIGPAPAIDNDVVSTGYIENTSGRITAIAAHPTDVNTIYVAAAGGGVWKTTDRGSNWTRLTDDQPLVPADKRTLFMGAIAVAPGSSNIIIYAGTGEANFGPSKARNFRDNIYYGRGILKSEDDGGSWTLLTGTGEDDTLDNFDRRAISQIVVDPSNPAIVYAAVGAQATNGLSGNTGIWKSMDGGLRWRNTTRLSISSDAAFTDLVMDPSRAQTLYAAVGGYTFAPDGTPMGDPANGIYKTTNGGDSWTLLVDPNLPPGEAVGRIALAIARSRPQVLYAALTRPSDNHLLGLRRTANGGSSWATVVNPGSICPSGGININYLGSAGDYHNTLAIDPMNPDIVYAGGHCLIARSTLGGTWFPVAPGSSRGPHRDHHALVFDAAGKLLNGNDGGIWRLFDPNQDNDNEHDPHMLHWTNLNGDLQITQFIGIALHPINPNIAYGGTQDTGTQRFQGSPQWRRLLRGDGGADAFVSPNRIYQITQILSGDPIFRRSDDGGDTWTPLESGINMTDPKNFYPPLAPDPSNSNRLLLGTDRVYETVTGGEPNPAFGDPPVGWRAISTPMMNGWDVSDRIDSLAVAELDGNTIYAVTGGATAAATGHIFVTIDGGANWRRRDIPGVTDHFRAILIDPANPLTAYVVRDRFGGGHVFQTTNGGESWTDISGNDPDPNNRLPDLPTYAIALDRRFTPNILYVGNDGGVYFSTDLGAHWARFGMGLPNAQVADLKLNLTLGILAAGTHGRGVWEILVPVP